MAQTSITLTTNRFAKAVLDVGDTQLIEVMIDLLRTTRIEIQSIARDDGTHFLRAVYYRNGSVEHCATASADNLRDLMRMMMLV